MKNFILSLFLCVFTLSVSAQRVDVKFGPLYPESRSSSIETAHVVDGNVFVVKSTDVLSRHMQVELFDSENLSLKNTIPFKQNSCGDEPNCLEPEFIYNQTCFFKNKTVMLFESVEKKKDIQTIWAQSIGSDGMFSGKMVKLDEIETEKNYTSGSFTIKLNNDSTQFLVISNPTRKKYEGEKLNFQIFGSDLKLLHSAKLALPVRGSRFSLIDYQFDNNGKVYILAQIIHEKKDRAKGKATEYYTIFVFDLDGDKVTEFDLSLDKKEVQDASIRVDDDHNQIICAGFYSDLKASKTSGNDIDGFFYMTVDIATEQIKTIGTKKIEKKIIQELMSRKKIKEGKGLSKDFDIIRITAKPDGSSMIIAEHSFVMEVTTTTTSNGMTTTRTTYHYYNNSIFIISIDAEGQVSNLITIPKKQHSVNDNGYFNSVMICEKDDRLIFIYNDHPENLNSSVNTVKETTPLNNFRKAVLVAVEVFPDGRFTKQKLQDNAKTKTIIAPRFGYEISDGTYIATNLQLKGICSCLAMFTKPKRGLVTFTIN